MATLDNQRVEEQSDAETKAPACPAAAAPLTPPEGSQPENLREAQIAKFTAALDKLAENPQAICCPYCQREMPFRASPEQKRAFAEQISDTGMAMFFGRDPKCGKPDSRFGNLQFACEITVNSYLINGEIELKIDTYTLKGYANIVDVRSRAASEHINNLIKTAYAQFEDQPPAGTDAILTEDERICLEELNYEFDTGMPPDKRIIVWFTHERLNTILRNLGILDELRSLTGHPDAKSLLEQFRQIVAAKRRAPAAAARPTTPAADSAPLPPPPAAPRKPKASGHQDDDVCRE